jgi:hypothetical protein
MNAFVPLPIRESHYARRCRMPARRHHQAEAGLLRNPIESTILAGLRRLRNETRREVAALERLRQGASIRGVGAQFGVHQEK